MPLLDVTAWQELQRTESQRISISWKLSRFEYFVTITENRKDKPLHMHISHILASQTMGYEHEYGHMTGLSGCENLETGKDF